MSAEHRRPENWPGLLFAYLKECEERRFEWGRHDCAHFAARWMETLGYAEPLAGFGAWSTSLGAARVQKKHGDFQTAVAGRMAGLGCPAVAPLCARRGDVALVKEGRRFALGVVVGAHVACPARTGVVMIPINMAVAAWRC
jgi:hypothetical protein